MSDLDDLTAALELGDPDETVGLPTVRAMAQAALDAGYFKRPEPVLTPEQVAELRERIMADGAGLMRLVVTAPTDITIEGNYTVDSVPMFPVPEGPDDGR